MADKNRITDEVLDRMLHSLADSDEHNPRPKQPVINTFRLHMEAERRRNRRQVQIVTVAAWVSVTATLALLAYFSLVLLPQIEKTFTPQTKFFFTQMKQSLAAYQGLFATLCAALCAFMLLGYVFSAALLIVKRDSIFPRNEK